MDQAASALRPAARGPPCCYLPSWYLANSAGKAELRLGQFGFDIGFSDRQQIAGVLAVVHPETAVVLDQIKIQARLLDGVRNGRLFVAGRPLDAGIVVRVRKRAGAIVLPDVLAVF